MKNRAVGLRIARGLTIILLLSLSLATLLMWSEKNRLQSQSWVPVTAKIRSVTVEKTTGGGRGNRTRYCVNVSVEYSYQASDFETLVKHHHCDSFHYSQKNAQEIYPPGSNFRLFVNQKNPEDTRLTMEFSDWNLYLITALTLFAAYVIFILSKHIKDEEQANHFSK